MMGLTAPNFYICHRSLTAEQLLCKRIKLNAVTGSGASYAKMDDNTAKGMEPSALAADILAAVAAGDHEVMACDLKTKAAVLARALLPGPLAAYMVSRAKKGWKDQQQ